MTRTLDKFQSTSSFLLRVEETFSANLNALCRIYPEKMTRSEMVRRLVEDAAEAHPTLCAERAQAEIDREALIKKLRLRVKGVRRNIVDMRIASALRKAKQREEMAP